jgi:hypothetical protein
VSVAVKSKIEWAFGADLTADPATWVWTDVSRYALHSVRRTFGRTDGTSQTQPAAATFWMANTDGRFTPRLATSPYYPNVRRQTPVRISLDPGSGAYNLRFQGYVDDIVPYWPAGNASYAEVQVTASGSLRRLGQGRSPFQSPLYRALSAAAPFAYWPLEDGPQADRLAATAGGTAVSLVRLFATGPAAFGAVRPPTGATAMPSFIRGGALDLQVSSRVASAWTLEFALFFGTGEPAAADYSTPNAMNVLKLYATNGDYWEFQLSPHNAFFTGGRVALFRSDAPEVFFDTLVDTTIGSFNPWDGRTHHVAVTASQSGGNIAWQLILDGAVYGSGTLVGRTLQPVDLVRLNQNGFLASSSTYGLGHLAVFESVVAVTAHASAAAGWSGETATARLTRLCAEQSVALTLSGPSVITMGPQGSDGFLPLLRECEAADGGILYDGRGPGLAYRTSAGRANPAVSVALDCIRGQVKLPFSPAEDDQRTSNDWTVSRPGGSFAHAAAAAHVALNGLYDNSSVVNVASDAMLADQASWRVHLGTVEEMRVPAVELQLIDHPELWTAWLGMTLSDRLTVANLPAQYPAGGLDAILEGGVEVWDAVSLAATANTSPAVPWLVGQLDSDQRLDCGASTLAEALDTTETGIDVAWADECNWTHARGDYLVVVGGEQMTVTAVDSAVRDTFTRSASSGWGTSDSGHVWTVGAGTAALFSATGTVGQIAVTALNTEHHIAVDLGSAAVQRVRVYQTLGVTPTGAAINWGALLRRAGASDFYWIDVQVNLDSTLTLRVISKIGGVNTQLSTAVSGTAHSTSVARILIAEIDADNTIRAKVYSSAAAEPAWELVYDASAVVGLSTGTGVGCIARLATGNTNAAPVNFAFDNFAVIDPQVLTVTRSINGVVKTHSAGEEVHVANPIILAL